MSYNEMNALAEKIAPGSEGLSILPFGNGAKECLVIKIRCKDFRT